MDHRILLQKLEHYEVTGISKICFSSYLTKRKQFVSIDNCNSATVCIN